MKQSFNHTAKVIGSGPIGKKMIYALEKFGIDKQGHTLSSPVKSNGIFFSTVRNSAYEWHMWLAWLYTILQHYAFFSFVVEHAFWLNNSPVNSHYESQKYMNHDSLKTWLSSIIFSLKTKIFCIIKKLRRTNSIFFQGRLKYKTKLQ